VRGQAAPVSVPQRSRSSGHPIRSMRSSSPDAARASPSSSARKTCTTELSARAMETQRTCSDAQGSSPVRFARAPHDEQFCVLPELALRRWRAPSPRHRASPARVLLCVNAVSKPEFVTGSAPAGPPHECRNAGCAADGPRASAPGSAAAGARSRCAWPRTPAVAGPRLGHADVAELCGPHRRPAAKAAVEGGPLPRMHPDTASVMPYTSSALPLSSVQANVAEFRRRTLAPDEARASRGSGLSSSRRSVCRGKR
jgi:hypothetical protein